MKYIYNIEGVEEGNILGYFSTNEKAYKALQIIISDDLESGYSFMTELEDIVELNDAVEYKAYASTYFINRVELDPIYETQF